MFAKQVSIFVENKKGSIADVISVLGKNNINIRALSVADTADYGILRLIVNEPEKAHEVLKAHDYVSKLTDVLAFAVADKPNGLGSVLEILGQNNIEITYIYSFVGHYNNQAIGVIKTTNLEETKLILEKNNVKTLKYNEIYKD